VHRPALVEGHVVGDVDQRADGPQAYCQQSLLHPGRARAVLDAAHEAQRKAGAKFGVVEVEHDLDRRFAGDSEGRRGTGLQRAEAGGGEIAGDAVDRGAVRTVGRQVDVDHRVVEAGIGGVA
jgi:hypothetical protein